jgi:hypothetical protein
MLIHVQAISSALSKGCRKSGGLSGSRRQSPPIFAAWEQGSATNIVDGTFLMGV